MTDKQIRELLASMSLEEKLGEMTQMAPNFFGTEDSVDLTGPMKEMNLHPEDVAYLGSTLNAFGAEKLIQMQKEHMAKQPHHIPLMFMADVIHGLKTIYPIPPCRLLKQPAQRLRYLLTNLPDVQACIFSHN